MVEQTASLHEKTVSDAESHVGEFKAPRTRAKAPGRSRAVTATKVHPLVMREAKKLCRGDLSRLRIIDAETVLVENPR